MSQVFQAFQAAVKKKYSFRKDVKRRRLLGILKGAGI